MDIFIYKTETIKIDKIYGGCTQKATVYKIIDSMPTFITNDIQWNTRSFLGANGEVLRYLFDNNIIISNIDYKLMEV